MRRLILALLLSALPTLTLAEPAGVIRDKDAFLALVNGKELRIGLYNLSLNVMPDHRISPWLGDQWHMVLAGRAFLPGHRLERLCHSLQLPAGRSGDCNPAALYLGQGARSGRVVPAAVRDEGQKSIASPFFSQSP
ncbi:hypothetical protein [Pseudotabrizicola alkalilacus]|uniref:hypothetical protein n=1 Tax=Pseudotabrizicola alkalilacus TaxID=2305252 RepID=UPI0011C1410F|nr:hypothetical protein [Pseudotabrizicola alkalilacus]